MRYELTDPEWAAIKLMLPNKPRGVPRVNDRRVLNGIFWVLRSGAPWRDLPKAFGPYTTCYNRFVRWRRAGVWSTTGAGARTTCHPVLKQSDALLNWQPRRRRSPRSIVDSLRRFQIQSRAKSGDRLSTRPHNRRRDNYVQPSELIFGGSGRRGLRADIAVLVQ
jgi:transposase